MKLTMARIDLTSLEWKVIVMGLVGLVLAPLFGLVAFTANPILVGVMVGMIGGIFMLTVPHISVWLILVLGLGSGALLSLLGPIGTRMSWMVSLLSALLLLPSVINIVWLRKVPLFVGVALIFLLFSAGVSFGRWYSASEFIGGFKRYFQGYGLMFALAALPFTVPRIEQWKKIMFAIALAQLPFCLFELIVLVPLRGGLSAGGEATDVVAGTFSANLVGGSSGCDLIAYSLISLAFLVARWREGLVSRTVAWLLGVVFFIPLALGESKIVVVLIPLIGLVLLKDQLLKDPIKYVPHLLILAILTAALMHLYVTIFMGSTYSEVLSSTIRYNLADQGYGQDLLNRSTVLSFWSQQQGWWDPLGFLFGHGLGSSYSTLGQLAGHIAANYPRYGINLTTASTLLWDLGVLGLILCLSIYVFAWRACSRLLKESQLPEVRADARAIQAALLIVFVFFNYTDALVNLVTTEVIFAAILGYLAILVRNHQYGSASSPAVSDQ